MSNAIPQPPSDYVPMASPSFRYLLVRRDDTGWTTVQTFDIERTARLEAAARGANYSVRRVYR